MKLTKCCFYPWSFMQIHAGGMMQPCAVGPDTDLGDFLIDYIEKKRHGSEEDFLNNYGLQMLREGMLTGNLRPMCRNCFFVSNDLITVEEFKEKLYEYLELRLGSSVDIRNADLKLTYAYSWMAISFTNRCNLSCVYCVQSVMKDTNPYFKAEIPYEYAEDILDMMASKGISRISTCVEGEATLYKYWYEVFSKFHNKYPEIEMFMTTNLNREFSETDMELLASYTMLDVSIDSLDPELYQQLRPNGRLSLLLKNLDKLDDKVNSLGKKGPNILLHMVVSNRTWHEMERIADFAFARGYGIQLGNYEERTNTIAYQTGSLIPIDALSDDEQKQVRDMIDRIRSKANRMGRECVIQGDIFTKVDKNVRHNYNRFSITGNNPVYESFLKTYPNGKEYIHFDVVYDRDNISYAGILIKNNAVLHLEQLPRNLKFVYREVKVYKKSKESVKCHFPVEPGYRKLMKIENDVLEFHPILNEDIDFVLLDISDWWIENEE